MILRDDMLELTRRMTIKRNSLDRIAGCYLDDEGYQDGSFNTNFLNLKLPDREKNLNLAKVIPFSETNVQLKDYSFLPQAGKKGGIWQLLMMMRECGLKNDALMDVFYELIAEAYECGHEYAIFVFHGRYDVPIKTEDKERQWESEEVYDYLICAICPLTGDYEPGTPECGFIFPAFMDRSSDTRKVLIYNANPNMPHDEIAEKVLLAKH
ncbi:MAG: DUF4317 family protein [Clostridiales bacterium]|nr:DUF4317 family protein [Candidatus Blautia equi]